jgi:hypothetical protein
MPSRNYLIINLQQVYYLEGTNIEQAKANRLVLRDFYSVLKYADKQLELVFITGISKFSKVSLFSHLNNLTDITLTDDYATLTGYTQAELEFFLSVKFWLLCLF